MPDFTPLSNALEETLGRLVAAGNQHEQGHDRILFSGNPHDALPRRLFLDRRLTPLERNAWQACRLLLTSDGSSKQPTYERLRPWLASTPTATMASYETVARALIVLRLTRWLSLIRRSRATDTGRLQGNVYVLHDEPLSPFEAMQLEPGYLELVSEGLDHASKVIRFTAATVLSDIAGDPMISEQTMTSRLEVLLQRTKEGCDASSKHRTQPVHSKHTEAGQHDSEEGTQSRAGPLASESEEGSGSGKSAPLRNPKHVSTVSNKSLVRTVPSEFTLQGLRLPPRFLDLKKEQREGVLMTLQRVQPGLRQAVLNEWDARCHRTAIRNPAGYLFGIAQKAIRGEFKPSIPR